MRNYGRTSLYEFLGDRVVYRNLVPMDRKLTSLAEVRAQSARATGAIVRKNTAEYGAVVATFLCAAQALDRPGVGIERLLYLGDTRMNDGTAVANICRCGGWRGLAFIGAENDAPARQEVFREDFGTLYLANRWALLAEFDDSRQAGGFDVDRHTAVVIDMDKTALGARGRNDHTIDQARVEAVESTVSDVLGGDFDPAAFREAYDRLNRPQFHPFTADNQDYLAYICLVLASGVRALDTVIADVHAGRLVDFAQFIGQVDAEVERLPSRLRPIHREIYAYVQGGDPTPFKAFRYTEYRTTVGRMGCMSDSTPARGLLKEEIVITQEVRKFALAWRDRGALLFGLSDKPDEASMPSAELMAQGYQPIHRTETHAVGE